MAQLNRLKGYLEHFFQISVDNNTVKKGHNFNSRIVMNLNMIKVIVI